MSGWPALGPDDESGETIRVHPVGFGPTANTPSSGPPHPAESPGYESQPSGPPYPGPSSGAPYTGPSSGAPYAAPAPRRSIAPLFMITVMVLTVVAGAVAVTYLLVGDRNERARPGHAVAAASGPPSASSGIDSCVIGEWQEGPLRYEDAESGMSLSAERGGVFRLRADGTGEMDYGSGVKGKGTIDGEEVEMMVMGREIFRYTTAGGQFTYTDVQIDARLVVFHDGRIVLNELLPAEDWDPERYTCSGETMQATSDGQTQQYRRR